MIHSRRLGLAATILLGFAPAAKAATPAADPAADTARCIAASLPQGAQQFRAADGSIRVLTIGRRGAVARWTVDGTGPALRVVRSGGSAGLDRLTGACLPDSR